jgi:hypothetical protein
MSQENRQTELHERTQQLLDGPLKHIRAAALAAVLLPLASVAPVHAQESCAGSSGGASTAACGVVWSDTNTNGILDSGEPGIEGVKVSVCVVCTGPNAEIIEIETDQNGFYSVDLGGPATVAVLIPTETVPSTPNVPGDESNDSDGVPNGGGFSVVTQLTPGETNDFGFVPSAVTQPGTGTPGYWKNHPEAWPVGGITIGGRWYTKDEAIAWLKKVGKDKTTTMFSSLVSAKLNVRIGNDGSCVSGTITAADAWMATYPVGNNVAASSPAWTVGEPLHQTLDNYNNGRLCAPHRD